MVFNIPAVIPNGAPFECHLSERLRTTIYRVTQVFTAPSEGFSSLVVDVDDFRAGITTSPEQYFAQNDLPGQFANDPDYRAWVSESCSTQHDTPRENPYVVLQTRQELNAWPATDGQCWKADLGRGEQLIFVDGGASVTIKADSVVSDSVFPRSSVKDTRTLIPVSASPATRV